MKKQKTTIREIRFQIDNPRGREMYAFFKKNQGKDLNDAYEAAAICGLVLNSDWTQDKIKVDGEELTTFVEFIHRRAAANDREFFKHLGQALSQKRKFKNAEIRHFLFKCWDVWDVTATSGLGLKHFTDEAVWELLEIVFPGRVPSLAAYREIRKAAFLTPERPPRIRQVTLGRDRSSVYARPRRIRQAAPRLR
jgi:hypothetical protein